MTLGVRYTYKIDAPYNMTEADVRHQGGFYDSIGIFPEFVDSYGILILPTTGRYFQMSYSVLVPKSVSNLLVAGRITGGDKISHAARRNMMCCTVSGPAQRRQSRSSMAYLSRIWTRTFCRKSCNDKARVFISLETNTLDVHVVNAILFTT